MTSHVVNLSDDDHFDCYFVSKICIVFSFLNWNGCQRRNVTPFTEECYLG